MTVTRVFLMFLSVSIALPAFAGRVDRRQGLQRARINEGVREGELTRKEAAELRAGQRHVRRLERRAEKDGQVSAEEAARLEKAQDRQSKRIYKEKHDGETRGQ